MLSPVVVGYMVCLLPLALLELPPRDPYRLQALLVRLRQRALLELHPVPVRKGLHALLDLHPVPVRSKGLHG